MASPHVAVATALLLLVGCVEPIELGSQCQSTNAECPSGLGQDDPGAPLVSIDGGGVNIAPTNAPDGGYLGGPGSVDASTYVLLPDGSVVVVVTPQLDGGLNAHGILPTLHNPSFEVTWGSPGPLAYSPIDPVPVGFNLAEPWSACGFGNSVLTSADSMRGSGKHDVLPTDGPGFVEANLGAPAFQGIRQTLDTPLKKDVRYSFVIDVRAAAGADVTLEIWGSFVDCVGATKLTDVGRVPESWISTCVSFVPPLDLPELFLQPSLRSTQSNGDLRVFFDNIRSDPSCQ